MDQLFAEPLPIIMLIFLLLGALRMGRQADQRGDMLLPSLIALLLGLYLLGQSGLHTL